MMTIFYFNENISREMFGSSHSKGFATKALAHFYDGQYSKVAVSDRPEILDSLENIYKIMQNGVVTNSWVLEPHPHVTPTVKPHEVDGKLYGWRSMSVGDIVQMSNGKLWLMASFGFEELPT